jgi:hypothetical protein
MMMYDDDDGSVVEWNALDAGGDYLDPHAWTAAQRQMNFVAFKLFVKLSSARMMTCDEFVTLYPRNKYSPHIVGMFNALLGRKTKE